MLKTGVGKMSTKKKFQVSVVLVIFMVLGAGCGLVQKTQDGATVVTPEGVKVLDAAAEIAEPAGQLATSLSLLWPPAAVLGGILAGAAGTWKKMKPEIVSARNNEQLSTAAGKSLVLAIEELKTRSPESWEKLKPLLEDFIRSGGVVENFVRELRGLPDKV